MSASKLFKDYVKLIGRNGRVALGVLDDRLSPEASVAVAAWAIEEEMIDRLTILSSDVRNELRGLLSKREIDRIVKEVCFARMFADHCHTVQFRVWPRNLEGDIRDRAFMAWRVFDDASSDFCQRSRSLLAPDMVLTPQGVARQSKDMYAIRKRRESALGSERAVKVWRRVSPNHQRMQWSPFWGLGRPVRDIYRLHREYGVPIERLSEDDFYVEGHLQPNVPFIIRPAAPWGDSVGGAPELVTYFDGVLLSDTSGFKKLVAGYLSKIKASKPNSHYSD